MSVVEVVVRGSPPVRLGLHERMTVLAGSDGASRAQVRRLLAAALIGRQPGSEVTFVDGLGRRLLARGWANEPAIQVLEGDTGLPFPGPGVLPTVVTVCADDLGVPTGPDDDEARRQALRRLLGLTGRSRAEGTPHGGPPLVLLDDAFARFDAHTTWDLLDLLERISAQARVQVLYLTDDPVVIGWARPRADLGRLALTTTTGT